MESIQRNGRDAKPTESLLGKRLIDEKAEEQPAATELWTPLVDVSEDDKEYLIKVELPEIKKSDIAVKVEKGVLSITGERKFQKEEKGKKYHRVERSYGHFTRNFTLPEDVDADNVKADFKAGVLELRLYKAEKNKPRKIEVNVA